MRRRFIFLAVAVVMAPLAAHAENIEEQAHFCAACHGENGVPLEQFFPVPVIWGQNLGYLFFQLHDFKSGTRKNDVMSPIIEALPREDLMALAQYFSKKPWPKLPQPHPPADVAVPADRAPGGKDDVEAGQVRRRVEHVGLDERGRDAALARQSPRRVRGTHSTAGRRRPGFRPSDRGAASVHNGR